MGRRPPLGRPRPDFYFRSTTFSHPKGQDCTAAAGSALPRAWGAQRGGHGVKVVQPAGSRPPVPAGARPCPHARPHLHALSSLLPGHELKTPPWRPSRRRGWGRGRRGCPSNLWFLPRSLWPHQRQRLAGQTANAPFGWEHWRGFWPRQETHS